MGPRGLILAGALGLFGVAVPVPAAVAAGCSVPKGVYTSTTPWAQRQLDLAELAPLSVGTGVGVAVIGTGIDAANPQFARGQVRTGQDVLTAGGNADTDCDGRGTFAAGLIGAQPDRRTTVSGVAPGASLIPIRYTQSTDSAAGGGDPARLAAAVDSAVALKARIILVAVPVTADSTALRSSVARAVAGGAVVVSPAAAAKAGQVTYPTSYPGVVAVAGVNSAGAPVTVESGRYVSISAPAGDLVSLAAGSKGALGHLWPSQDPSFAAAYVAGVLADVESYLPKLTGAQAVNRVLATAGTGTRTDRTGWGLIDPIRAVTASLPASVVPSASTAGYAGGTVSLPVAAPASRPVGRGVGYLAFGGLGLAALVASAAVTIRRGARRRWRPGTAVRADSGSG